MAHEKILVIEDDDDIQELMKHHLSKEGYRVTLAGTGEDGASKVTKEPFDCVLLDLMLPGMDGLDVCKLMKKNPKLQNVPVIMVTAKGEESDIVSGLELGADDYILKPFSPKVLIARVRATLRRKSREMYNGDLVLQVRNIEIHPGKHEVNLDGVRLDLTHMEFQVLHLLASQPGWVFTRNQIIDNVRDDNDQVTDRSVDVVIVGLRRKLGSAGDFIETVRGVGYRFLEQ
jgi:two-component system, OmpR family, alkaline phosphatase synthesis response regulator PhoP